MLSVKPSATGSFYILGFVSGLFFYYCQWDPKCVLFLLYVRLFVNRFVCCFILDETQRGSGSQESAVERRLGPCAVVCVYVCVCVRVCVRCVSVHGSDSALCAVPPSSLLPLPPSLM